MTVGAPTFADALARAELLHGRSELEAVIAAMGKRIDAALGGERAVFLTVMNGALVFAGHLALAIRTDLVDYVHATRYRGNTSGSALEWIRQPTVPLRDRLVLLVDDILDEGTTLKAIRDDCFQRGGARRVWIASLCRKAHDRVADGVAADFNGVVVPDRYVFGFGMDYHEQGRNLPGIYALPEAADR